MTKNFEEIYIAINKTRYRHIYYRQISYQL